VPMFASIHGYVLDEDLEMKLTPQDLLVELRAQAIFPGNRRTYVLHYSMGPESAERIDPVALQPQDFVHEWLLRPWEELQSRSSEAGLSGTSFCTDDCPGETPSVDYDKFPSLFKKNWPRPL
jgi:hypothetical protein